MAAALELDAPYAVSPEGLARGQAWLRLCGHPGVTWSCLSRASPSLRPASEWQAFGLLPCALWVSLADTPSALSPVRAQLGSGHVEMEGTGRGQLVNVT